MPTVNVPKQGKSPPGALKIIGGGFQGRVYLVDLGSGNLVAKKVTPNGPDSVRELRVLRLLREHPHVIHLIVGYEDEGDIILVMPVLQQTLQEVLTERSQNGSHWSWQCTKNGFLRGLGLKITKALTYVHEKTGCVHGDIKGNNVMVQNQEPCIIDFGCTTEDDSANGDVQSVTMLFIYIGWFKTLSELQRDAIKQFPGHVDADDCFAKDLALYSVFEQYEIALRILPHSTKEFHNVLAMGFFVKINIYDLFLHLQKCTAVVSEDSTPGP